MPDTRPATADLPLRFDAIGADEVRVRSGLPYKRAGSHTLTFDLFVPALTVGEPGVVVFVHGEHAAMETAPQATAWAQYQGWGRVVAALGMMAVTFNHRPSRDGREPLAPVEDVEDLLAMIRGEAPGWGADPWRLALIGISAGAFVATQVVIRSREAARCLVDYYGPLPVDELDRGVALPPTLIVRAAHDHEQINASIDAFVAKARATGQRIRLVEHESAGHAFDVVDDVPRTRAIIEETLGFVAIHVNG